MKHALSVALAATLLVLLGGCATAPSLRDAAHRDSESVHAPAPVESSTASTSAVPEDPQGDGEDSPPLRQVSEGSGRFIDVAAAARRPPATSAAGEVTFNFEGESLQAVIKTILGDLLQENYVIAPGVQGSVTFSTARPIRADQAMSVLEMLLSWNNAAMIWGDGRYTIVPVDRAISGNLSPRSGPLSQQRGYEVRAVPLRFISATEMEKVLKPYARPQAIVNVDNARNLLILGGTRAELELYLQTIEIFDVDWLEGMSVGIFPLVQAEASKVVGELEKLFGDGANTPMAGMFRFLVLEGVNSVLVITPQPRYLGAIEEWLERFDLGGDQAAQRLYVYDVKNVKATDLAATLGDIFGTGGGSVATSTRSPSGDPLMPGLNPVEVRTLGRSGQPELPEANKAAPARSSGGGSRGAGGNASGGATAVSGPVVDGAGGIALGSVEEVRISAVEESNALLVRATAGQWESIRRTIERLDTIPLQVFIEAQIVRVTLNEDLEFGVQWFFENAVPESFEGGQNYGLNLQSVAANRTSLSGIGGLANSGGLGWSFVGPSAAAIISTLDSVSKATVLSAPTLTVLNNKSATINVGTQIPVTSSFINSGGNNTGNLNQSYVQFRQTGITLTVTPRVNPGGLVFMEVDQQESAPVGAPNASGNQAVDNRTITTEVAVQSGQTVVLGGLIKNTDQRGREGIPGLSRIPVLGSLFGRQARSEVREELMVLITPRVIYSEADARRITDDYRRQFRGLEPLNILRPIPRQDVNIETD